MPFPLYRVPKVKRLLRLEPEHAKALNAKEVKHETPASETAIVTEVAVGEE